VFRQVAYWAFVWVSWVVIFFALGALTRRVRLRLAAWLNGWGWHGVVHFLYVPTMMPGAEPLRWHHHVHLIPGAVLERSCEKYDLRHPRPDDPRPDDVDA
jgi:hypothetical protein